MPIIFRYVHVPREDGTLRHAPFIPIYASNRFGKAMQIIALIDSGADNTVIPKDLAEVLGLRETDSEDETGGIGGKVKVRSTKLDFKIKGGLENYSLSVPALVLQDQNSDVPLLLGRNGFFEHFHITFKQNEEKIVLKKIQPEKKY